jgi:hypothetical protein
MLDLVGLPYRAGGVDPYSGVDCLWAARQALSRVFPEMPDSAFPLDKAAALYLLDAKDGHWQPIENASRLGDVVVGDQPEPWVAVLVDPVGRYFFTANRLRGTHLVFQGNIGRVAYCFRYKGA